jgi:hypothetical protein
MENPPRLRPNRTSIRGYALSFFLITIPTYRVSKSSSTSRRKGLISRVTALEEAVVMPCSPYVSSSAHYVFSSSSLKCFKCIRRGVTYDENAFMEGFDKIESKKKKLELAR